MPLECFGVVCDWDEAAGQADRLGELPGAVHAPRRRRRGARPPRRPAPSPDAARLGRLVRDQGRRAPVRRPARARIARARRARALDRGPARAPRRERRGDGTRDDRRGGVHGGRRARRAPLRRDRGRGRLCPRTRARDALPDARLALGRVPRPRCRRSLPRRADEHPPVGAQPRVRRAAALLRPRARRWRSPRAVSGSIRPSSRAGTSFPPTRMPYRTPSGSLYDSGDYEACLDRALELARYDELRDRVARAREDGRLAGIGLACVVEPSISNMGYITLAQTAVERAGQLPKSGNAEGASVAIDPLGGITVRLGTTPQGQGHRTVCAQVVADELGCAPEDVTVLSELDTQTTPWTVASGNYSSRFSGVGVGAVRLAASRVRAKIDAIREHAGEPELPLRKVAGMAHWNPEGLPQAMEPGLAAIAFWAAAEPRPAGRRGPRRILGGARVHRRRLCGRDRRRDGRRRGRRLRHRARRGRPAQSAPRRRPDRSAASRTARRPPSSSATSTTSRAA